MKHSEEPERDERLWKLASQLTTEVMKARPSCCRGSRRQVRGYLEESAYEVLTDPDSGETEDERIDAATEAIDEELVEREMSGD